MKKELESVDDVNTIAVPNLMLQGGDDQCNSPAETAGQERWFENGYPPSVE